MREIKFRAWDTVEKKYRNFDGMHDTMMIDKSGKIQYYNLQNGSGGDEYVLEQFTGIKDKNGKEIYEGDVVRIGEEYEGWASEVEFNGGAFSVEVEGYDYDFTAVGWVEYEIEIIGNIHDQKEDV